MTRFGALAAAVALAVAAAGCGGSSSTSERASGTPTTTAATTGAGSGATAATTTGSSSSETTATVGSSTGTATTGGANATGAAPARCLEFAAAAAKLSEALAASGGAPSERDSLEAYFSGVAAKAPASIREAFETLAAAIGRYVEALDAAGVKPGSAPSGDALAKLQQALKEIDNAEVRQASAKIEAWVKGGCR